MCCSVSGRVGKEGSGNSAPDSSPEIDILVGFKDDKDETENTADSLDSYYLPEWEGSTLQSA